MHTQHWSHPQTLYVPVKEREVLGKRRTQHIHACMHIHTCMHMHTYTRTRSCTHTHTHALTLCIPSWPGNSHLCIKLPKHFPHTSVVFMAPPALAWLGQESHGLLAPLDAILVPMSTLDRFSPKRAAVCFR